MTTIIREVNGYQLNHEPLMNNYNVSEGNRLSFWFDVDTSNELLKLDDEEFIDECNTLFDISNI